MFVYLYLDLCTLHVFVMHVFHFALRGQRFFRVPLGP
jgi:hypothetical protein